MSEIFVLNLEVTPDGRLTSHPAVDKKKHFFSGGSVTSTSAVLRLIERHIDRQKTLRRSPVAFEIKTYRTAEHIGWIHRLDEAELSNGTKLAVVEDKEYRADLQSYVDRYLEVIQEVKAIVDEFNNDPNTKAWGMKPIRAEVLVEHRKKLISKLAARRAALVEVMVDVSVVAKLNHMTDYIGRLAEREQDLTWLTLELDSSIFELGNCLGLNPADSKKNRIQKLMSLGFGEGFATEIVINQSPAIDPSPNALGGPNGEPPNMGPGLNIRR